MFYTHTLSFLLLIFANTDATKVRQRRRFTECAESVSLVPTLAKSNPAQTTQKTKEVPAKVKNLTINPPPMNPKVVEKTKVETEKINVNEATPSELESLPGIGPNTCQTNS